MTIYDIAIIPLIVGIVELLKQIGLPSKFAALVSVLLGIAIGVVYLSPNDIKKGILVGLALGLAASGLYSGTKSTVEGIKSLFIAKDRK
jgi:L-cystine uptake protein TcyP (sodium:dicarboxylate symporter family)